MRSKAGAWGSSSSWTSASHGASCPGRVTWTHPKPPPTRGSGLSYHGNRRAEVEASSRKSYNCCRTTSRASGFRSRTCRSTSTTRPPSSTGAPLRSVRFPAARRFPTASSQLSRALPAPPVRPAASAPATVSSAPATWARTAPTASTTSGGCSPSRDTPVLSDDLREELAAIAPARECDRLAELSGLFHVAGRAHLRGRGSVDVHLDVSSSTVARRAFALLRSLGVTSEIRPYRRRAFDQATRYQLHVEGSESAYEILNRAGVLDRSHRPLDRPPQRVVARRCCAAAYLRGALLGSGTLSGPRGPHLEIRTAEAEGARYLAGAAERLGAELRVQDRASHATAYAKGTEAIADVLVAVGAVDLVLALEEQAVLAATRADANRLANADHANLVRTGRAAHAQLEALHRLDVDALPDDLREIALLRVRHPTASTAELARRCKPALSKAAAYRRLRRLQELSQL